mmetsp:Transcript_92241/g.264363  ORF Transcript_92241/g.264363 Transcript_92241/m.264363 type:complete len:337 (+) Transcript_92241:75-1085(+)
MGNIIKPMWAECPAVTRLMLAAYPTMGLGFAILKGAADVHVGWLFECSLHAIWSDMGVWTLFLSGFFHRFSGGMSFLMLLLELYMGMMYLPKRERELGSLTFFLWLLLVNVAVNVLFLIMVAVVCAAWDPRFYFIGNSGLWPIIIVLLSLHLLADPEGSTSFWGLVSVPNKWYPLFFVVVFSLMNALILWNHVAAIAVGYVAFLRPALSLERLLPSQSRVTAWERHCCSQPRQLLGGSWLPASGARGPVIPQSSGGGGASGGVGASVFGLQMQARSSGGGSGGFTAFSGKGQRLGSSDDVPASMQPVAMGAGRSEPAGEPDEESGEEARLVSEPST